MKVLFHQKRFLQKRRNWQEKAFIFMLLLFLFSVRGFCQNTIPVKGKVTNQSGEPVVGASVLIKGTTKGVTTSPDGTFEINAEPSAMLIVSFVGFTDKEVKVNGNQFLNITLSRSETGLNEVVVIGYGSQRKEAITGSVSS